MCNLQKYVGFFKVHHIVHLGYGMGWYYIWETQSESEILITFAGGLLI